MKSSLVALAVLIGILVLVVWMVGPQPGWPTTARPTDQVILRPATGNIVQMFDSAGVDATVVRQFPAGTSCTKFGGPTTYTVEGISMSFYRLTCNGVTGYVNAKWVNP